MNFNARIILGGYQISYTNKNKLSSLYPLADVFISSYSEESLREFFTSNIKNNLSKEYPLYYNSIVDFEKLISPYTSLEIPIHSDTKTVRIETKRGCCFQCSFCAHRDVIGQKIRSHNLLKVYDELYFLSKKNISKVNIIDPIFNVGSSYLSIMDYINKLNNNSVYSLQTRFETINDNFINMLEGGKYILEIGLQTTNIDESIVINRKNNIELISKKLKILKTMSLDYEVSLIYGLPKQTYSSFEKSVDFLLEHGCKNIVAFPLMLYQGTKLYEQKQKYDLKEEVLGDYNLKYVTSSKYFDKKEWERMANLADRLNNLSKEYSSARLKVC